MNGQNQGILVGISGASGAIYGLKLVTELLRSHKVVHLVVSEWGQKVIAQETGRELSTWLGECKTLASDTGSNFIVYDALDMASNVASGSYRLEASVIVPCSVATLGSIANGNACNLLHRSAAVALKEGWPLVLVPRETPLSLVDLKNLVSVAQAGAVVLPAMPGFYHQPKSVEQLVDYVVGKILDRLGIEHTLFSRWQGKNQ